MLVPAAAPGCEGARRTDCEGRERHGHDDERDKDLGSTHDCSCDVQNSTRRTAELGMDQVRIVCPRPASASSDYAPWASAPAIIQSPPRSPVNRRDSYPSRLGPRPLAVVIGSGAIHFPTRPPRRWSKGGRGSVSARIPSPVGSASPAPRRLEGLLLLGCEPRTPRRRVLIPQPERVSLGSVHRL